MGSATSALVKQKNTSPQAISSAMSVTSVTLSMAACSRIFCARGESSFAETSKARTSTSLFTKSREMWCGASPNPINPNFICIHLLWIADMGAYVPIIKPGRKVMIGATKAQISTQMIITIMNGITPLTTDV